MKKLHHFYRILLQPFFIIGAVVLFILDNFNVNINPMISYTFKEKVALK